MMATYHATVEHSGRYWTVHVAEIDRATQVRHLRELETMTEDLIEVMGAEPGPVEYDIRLPEAITDHLRRAEELRASAAGAQSAAASEVRIAARDLHDSGLPLRDIGRVLGVRINERNSSSPAEVGGITARPPRRRTTASLSTLPPPGPAGRLR